MSALTSDITDAAANSLTTEAPLLLTKPEADLGTTAPPSITSRMEEAKVEGQRVDPLGVSERCSHPVSLQDFALWMKKNIHKKECRFFDRDKR